jgi:hypothetical protein
LTAWIAGVGATGVGEFLSIWIVLTRASPPITSKTRTVATRDFNGNYPVHYLFGKLKGLSGVTVLS